MNQDEVMNIVVLLNLNDDDVLFVDAEAIDCKAFAQHPSLKNKRFSVVPVFVPPGKNVADCLAVSHKETTVKVL